MKIAIACDHGGFKTKDDLMYFFGERGIKFIDCGCSDKKSCDYPDFAKKALSLVLSGEAEKAILICSTGIGMSVVANKFKGIRASLVYNEDTAKQAREHLDANVLCLGAQHFDYLTLRLFTSVWLNTKFSQGVRHIRRLKKIEE